MVLFKTIAALRSHLEHQRNKGRTIGFVPTMGALHNGHSSLIRHSLEQGHYTVVSIYVNPTQFNDPVDLEKYPRPLSADLELLNQIGCNAVFLPGDSEIYPVEGVTTTEIDLQHLGDSLEAAFRPGHFEGVLQVMHRLLDIVNPDFLFMGQKDLQQLAVVRQLISEAGFTTRLVGLPIVREENGLARSSRNERLSASERKKAGLIYKTLLETSNASHKSSLTELKFSALERLEKAGLRPEYFEFVRSDNLRLVHSREEYDGPITIVTAVWVGDVRLIDNMEMA